MHCVAVLTRGYAEAEKYNLLIKRNQHVSRHLNDKSTDILLFHEGNITQEHQVFIQSQTPELKLQFVDVPFPESKKAVPVEEAPEFGLGYRHMCSFWFIHCFKALAKYAAVVRIDEDCFVDSNIDQLFLHLQKYTFVCGATAADHAFVTRGLNAFTLAFLKRHSRLHFKPKAPSGPYTNLFGMALDRIRANPAFQSYALEVERSDMIYRRRWGDLPLWGEAIFYLFGQDSLKIDSTLSYYHESHEKYVNEK